MMEKEAKSRECFSLSNTRQTLVSGVTDADVSVCWLTLVCTLFSSEHQTRRWNGVRRRASASVASYISSSAASATTDAGCVWCTIDGRVWWVLDCVWWTTDSYWTASGERRTRDFRSDGRVCWRENVCWKFDCAGHVAASWATDAGCRVCCAFLDNGSIRRGTSIYICWPALGLDFWHFDILVSILS
jgi:hypothetical protein